MSYSIFNHAQLGQVCEAVQHSDQKACKPCEPVRPVSRLETTQQRSTRVRSPRGWAVAAGLGLGPAFKRGSR